MRCRPALLLGALCFASSGGTRLPTAEEAKLHFLRWVDASSIPGGYTTTAERAAVTAHPGDLTHTRIFDSDLSRSDGRPFPHSAPNPVFAKGAGASKDERRAAKAARERMLEAVAWLLRRGMSRLQDAVLPLLAGKEEEEMVGAEVALLLSLARRALDSFEDFWHSVRWTVSYGPHFSSRRSSAV